jgi:hypothetical protein
LYKLSPAAEADATVAARRRKRKRLEAAPAAERHVAVEDLMVI